MNDELKTILSQLDHHVTDMPAERIYEELLIISERLTFAQVDPREGAFSEGQKKQITFLLGEDVSAGMVQFTLYLAAQHALHYLMDDLADVFMTYCKTYYSSRKQIRFISAIPLGDDMRQFVLELLQRDQPVDSRILLSTDRSLMAGFMIAIDDQPPVDYSIKAQVVPLIKQYLTREQQEYHAATN